jgi:hypothetical protein
MFSGMTHFGYRSPIRSDYETTLSIRNEYFGSENPTNRIGFGLDLHTCSDKCTPEKFFVQLPCTLGVRNVAKHLKLEGGGGGGGGGFRGFYLKFELQY